MLFVCGSNSVLKFTADCWQPCRDLIQQLSGRIDRAVPWFEQYCLTDLELVICHWALLYMMHHDQYRADDGDQRKDSQHNNHCHTPLMLTQPTYD
jgi:hypothetical protein